MEILSQPATIFCGERSWCMASFPPCPIHFSVHCFWLNWLSFARGLTQSPLNGTERSGMPSVSFGSSLSKQQVKAEVPFLMSHSDTTDTEAKVCSMFQWSSSWTQTLHLRNLYFFDTNANAIQTFDKSNYLFTNLQYQLEESLRIYASLISFSFSSLESFSNSTNLTE